MKLIPLHATFVTLPVLLFFFLMNFHEKHSGVKLVLQLSSKYPIIYLPSLQLLFSSFIDFLGFP